MGNFRRRIGIHPNARSYRASRMCLGASFIVLVDTMIL